MRIKINLMEATAARAPLTAAEQKAKLKALTTALKEAQAKVVLAKKLSELKLGMAMPNISQAQKDKYKVKIKAVMEKAGITRTPDYGAALHAVEVAKQKLIKAREVKADKASVKSTPTKAKPAVTKEQRFVKEMKKILSQGYDFVTSSGRKYKGMTGADINEELKGHAEFGKMRTSTQLQMMLRREGLNVMVSRGQREGRGKEIYFWHL